MKEPTCYKNQIQQLYYMRITSHYVLPIVQGIFFAGGDKFFFFPEHAMCKNKIIVSLFRFIN